MVLPHENEEGYHFDPELNRWVPNLEDPFFTYKNPVALAGVDQQVKPKSKVILDGSKSHHPQAANAQIINYQWKQLVGPAVQLAVEPPGNNGIVSFTTPNIDTPVPTCDPGWHWDPVENKCVKDDIDPPPTGKVLWDSDVHLKTGKAFKITDTYGDQKPDGKGVFMAASGNPYIDVDPDGTFHLEAGTGHGRVYIKALNFNSRMEGYVMIETPNIDNTTQRLRSRHGEGGACSNRFGGFGHTFKRDVSEYQTESCHNNHENALSKKLTTAIKDKQWIGFKYSCYNSPDNKEVNFKTEYSYDDGKTWVTVNTGKHPNPQAYYMDVASFMKESYAWLRINNTGNGSVAYKHVKIEEIEPATLTSRTIFRDKLITESDEADEIVLSFELTVTDTRGFKGVDVVNVIVSNTVPDPTNHPPIANAGFDQEVKPETSVTLNGSQSHDTDPNDTIKYEWSQTMGPIVTLADKDKPVVSFTAP